MRETFPACDKEQELSILPCLFATRSKNRRICSLFLSRQGRIIASAYFFAQARKNHRIYLLFLCRQGRIIESTFLFHDSKQESLCEGYFSCDK